MLRWFETRIDPFRTPPASDPPPRVLAFYWYFIRQAPLPIVALMLVSGVSTTLEIVVFVYLGRAVDLISRSGQGTPISDAVYPLLWQIPALLLLALVFGYLHLLITDQAIFGPWNNQIRWQSHRRVLRRRLSFFQGESSGRIATHVHETGNTIVGSVVSAIQGLWHVAVLLIGSVVVFAGLHWAFLVPIAIWVAGFVAVVAWLMPRTRKAFEAQFEQRSQLSGRFVDAYSNITAVKLFGGSDTEDAHVRSGILAFLTTIHRAMRLATIQSAAVITLDSLLIGAVFVMALVAAINGTLPIGAIVVATALVLRLHTVSFAIVGGISGLVGSIGTVQNALKSIAPAEPDPAPRPASGFVIRDGVIAFQDVAFGYPGGDRVLDGLSFQVPARTSLGVVGLSGAGKSTILNLLAGLYPPDSGSIAIDGRDIATIAETELWNGLSVVTQDPLLFNRSVRDNVLYGRPDATPAEVERALAEASATDFVARLVDTEGRRGLDAHIGERGVKLSGGQRQRLAIARALLKNAPILVLDEPTSALDSETEGAIQNTLARLARIRTLVVIAHRVSTIASLDRIIVLDKGKIVEAGSHQELSRLGGLYQRFWRRQSEARSAEEVLAAATAAE